VRPAFLWWLLAANIALLTVRTASVVDAHGVAAFRRSSPVARGLLAAIVLAVIVPHAVVASYSLDAIDVLDTVFVADDVLAPLSEREQDLLASGLDEEDLGPVLSTTTTSTAPVATTGPIAPAPTTVATLAPSRDDGSFEGRDREFIDPEFFSGEPLETGRLTFLLAGGDAGPGRSGLRTDTMIVATLDLETGRAIMFALPRNLARVPLPPEFEEAFIDLEMLWWEKELAATTTTVPPTTTTTTTVPPTTTTTVPPTTTTTVPPTTTTTVPPTTTTTTTVPPFESCHCYVDILNSLYARTNSWVRTFPDSTDPGMEALGRTISHLLGLKIDYYVLVDMAGFVALVDALGGVDVYFEKPMHIAFSPAEEGGDKAYINVDTGVNHLDGLEALAYVRNRYRSSDYVRMERQRCMLRSIAAEADVFTLIRRFSAITEALRNNARTNIPLDLLPELIRQVSRLDFADIDTIAFTPGPYAPTRDFGRYPIPDPERIRAKVAEMLAGRSSGSGGSSGTSECDPPAD
jgi:LCP family protein required for cell wall assembly